MQFIGLKNRMESESENKIKHTKRWKTRAHTQHIIQQNTINNITLCVTVNDCTSIRLIEDDNRFNGSIMVM